MTGAPMMDQIIPIILFALALAGSVSFVATVGYIVVRCFRLKKNLLGVACVLLIPLSFIVILRLPMFAFPIGSGDTGASDAGILIVLLTFLALSVSIQCGCICILKKLN